MAQFQWMPVNVPALIADTSDMNSEMFGAYCRVLFSMWLNGGSLPDDAEQLKNICRFSRYKFEKYFPDLMQKFEHHGGTITQKRLTATWLKVSDNKRKRALAANVKWGRKKHANAQAAPMQMHEFCISDAYAMHDLNRKKERVLGSPTEAPASDVPASDTAPVEPNESPTKQENGRREIGTPELAAILKAKARRG